MYLWEKHLLHMPVHTRTYTPDRSQNQINKQEKKPLGISLVFPEWINYQELQEAYYVAYYKES